MIFDKIKHWYYRYRVRRYFREMIIATAKLNKIMIKANYPRHKRRRIQQQLIRKLKDLPVFRPK